MEATPSGFIILANTEVELLQAITTSDFLADVINGDYYWHKIEIHGGDTFSREELLDAVLDAASPHELVPVKYGVEDGVKGFLIQQSYFAVRSLCATGLVIKLGLTSQVLLKIILRFKPFHDYPLDFFNIMCALNQKRFRANNRILDMSYYSNDPALADFYFPISHPVNFRLLLNSLKLLRGQITDFRFCHNNLYLLDGIELLKEHFPIRSLDLRYNKLTWTSFSSTALLVVHAIRLDYNPLCADVNSVLEYISKVQNYVPSIKILDDFCLSDLFNKKIPLLRHSAIKKPASDLINSFLMHFAKVSKSVCATAMYHENAILSLCIKFIPYESSSAKTGIHSLIEYDRNLLKMSDFTKAIRRIISGPINIVKTLFELPIHNMDRNTCSVDLLFYDEDKSAVINIMAVYKDNNNENLYSCDRTVVLVPAPGGAGEWQITNEMMTISNATTNQCQKSFNKDIELSEVSEEPTPLLDTFEELTTMNRVYCQKFLEEANWNLEGALQAFVDKLKVNMIPVEAFSKVEEVIPEVKIEQKPVIFRNPSPELPAASVPKPPPVISQVLPQPPIKSAPEPPLVKPIEVQSKSSQPDSNIVIKNESIQQSPVKAKDIETKKVVEKAEEPSPSPMFRSPDGSQSSKPKIEPSQSINTDKQPPRPSNTPGARSRSPPRGKNTPKEKETFESSSKPTNDSKFPPGRNISPPPPPALTKSSELVPAPVPKPRNEPSRDKGNTKDFVPGPDKYSTRWVKEGNQIVREESWIASNSSRPEPFHRPRENMPCESYKRPIRDEPIREPRMWKPDRSFDTDRTSGRIIWDEPSRSRQDFRSLGPPRYPNDFRPDQSYPRRSPETERSCYTTSTGRESDQDFTTDDSQRVVRIDQPWFQKPDSDRSVQSDSYDRFVRESSQRTVYHEPPHPGNIWTKNRARFSQ